MMKRRMRRFFYRHFNPADFFQRLADRFSDEMSYAELESENSSLRAEIEELECTIAYLRG